MSRLATLIALGISTIACQAEWTSLFNGKNLDGWSGDPQLWRVEEGVIVGETNDADKKTAANTFLIWQGGEPGDFTFECKARVTGKNNSGVQYRSRVIDKDKWSVGGYQMDLHPKQEFLGMLYEERGRGIACQRGQKVDLAEKPAVTGNLEVPQVDLAQWNSYRIVARGHTVRHYVNDQLAAEITDTHPDKRAAKGVIALQLHAGPPMKAEFKDLRIMPVAGAQAPEDVTGSYQVAPGFKLERVYQVPKDQGSWVSITEFGKKKLLCADQYGGIYQVTLPDDPAAALEIMPLDIALRGAHGLLWHRDVLWVSICEGGKNNGVWRVTDSNGDGLPDQPEHVIPLRGGGEHGPHSLVPSPDGQHIWLVAGNHTDPPEFARSLVTPVWQEDQLLPRQPDARGHANNRMAPGGWIARFDPDGRNLELVSAGYRNCYDLAFNEHGDAVTYDADMEWDLGMPWYRPTRFCLVTPGSEFGWRHGTGKWPEYYEDSVPTLLDIGPGSPTGVVSGKGARFPAKYQRAVFGLDWTFATIYAVHLTPHGRGYTATREEFIAGSGLPLTDAVIAGDGAMYFLTGGRRTGSAMWRVSYTGAESTAPVEYRSKPLGLMNPAEAEKQLGSDERITRFEARTALEHQGADALVRILDSKQASPWQTIHSAIGLARVGAAAHAPVVLAALESLDWSRLDTQARINWLRAAGLVFARHGKPDDSARGLILAKIDNSFPSGNAMLDRELCRMLAYLNAPGVVARTLNLMDAAGPENAPDWLELAKRNKQYGGAIEKMIANLPPTQVIHFTYCLRVVPGPWRDDERQRYFTWLGRLAGNSGGASYTGFIKNIRKDALTHCTPEEQEKFATAGEAAIPNPLANLPAVEGPGRNWTVDEIVKIAEQGLAGRSKERGHNMFRATMCAACHRFGNEGGSSGPDLSNLAGRFTIRDLAESIVEPGKVISDQYHFETITRPDGSQISGRIIESTDARWTLATNPYDLTQTIEIARNQGDQVKPSPASPMPPGLVNRLNEEELKDLLGHLMNAP